MQSPVHVPRQLDNVGINLDANPREKGFEHPGQDMVALVRAKGVSPIPVG
jgi:hypothetical protein